MTKRLDKIQEKYDTALYDKLFHDDILISFMMPWDILISADTSKNKKNVRWLVETYINNGYLWEDIEAGPTSKVAETLIEFDKHKRNLEPSERSLTKYKTLGALWSAIKLYVNQLTANEEKKEEREKAYAECEVIVDREDGFKIVIPMTEYASKWFGRGTRWCTAAKNNNMFEAYAKDAPLFIIFMPDGEKLQLWKNGDDVQFMDENDGDVSLHYIEDNWNILEPICKWTGMLQYIPRSLRDYKLCMEFVRKYGYSLQEVPEEYMDKEMCLEAVKQNGYVLYGVWKKFKDYEVCISAVKQNGLALKYVPENLIDEKMCLTAIKQNGEAIRFIQDNEKTYELCKMAYEQNSRSICYIPKIYDTSTWIKNVSEEKKQQSQKNIDDLYEEQKRDLINAVNIVHSVK